MAFGGLLRVLIVLIAFRNSACVPELLPHIEISTSYGKIVVQLRADVAPKHCEAVLDLVNIGAYSHASFYRADKDYVLQGGLYPKANPKYGKGKTLIPLEYNLRNLKGTVTMARWEDLSSGDGEFFINLRDNPNLDKSGAAGWQAGFTVFGEVISGMDVAFKLNHMGPLSGSRNIPFSIRAVEIEPDL